MAKKPKQKVKRAGNTKTKSRRTTKKVTRRKRKTAPALDLGVVVEIDQVFKIINRVQLTREAAEFVVRELDSYVAENILRDAELKFKKASVRVESLSNCFRYTIDPPKPREMPENFDEFDEFPDEIIEDGQIFF